MATRVIPAIIGRAYIGGTPAEDDDSI